MITPEQDALVQGLVDGSLSPADQETAERLLASNADARRRSEELAELGRLLDELGPAEPPVALTSYVMKHVGHSPQLTYGGFGMGKKVMWGLVAAAAIALVVMRFTGYPPLDGAEGTIGAAKRYQAPQMTSQDVKLGDESVQAFMQSDVFEHIMKDDATRRMLSDPGFRDALASPGVAKALSSSELRVALTNPDFAKGLTSSDFAKSFKDPGLAKALSDPALVQALKSPAFTRALTSPEFAKGLTSQAFVQALASPGFVQALASPEFAKGLNDSSFSKGLKQ